MRTKNEKRLLVVLFLVVFAMANFYGYKWFAQKQALLVLTEKKLRADKAEAEVALKKQDIWAQRKAWIAQHEPSLGGKDGNAKAAEVLETIRKEILDKHLEVLDQSPNETQQTPAGARVNISIKIKGPMKGICEWLADLQKPENFYAVTRFSLKADQDQKSMICSLELAQYFKGGSK
jgi:hypothetical protein